MLETTTITETSLLSQPEHSLDIVLCSDYIKVPNHFDQVLLGRETFRCIMSSNHPLAQKSSISLDDYLNYGHILLNMGGSGMLISDVVLGERAKERRFAFRTPYFLTALETGKLGSAALDVFDGEPHINPRFLELNNALLQPHHASGTVETRADMGQLMLANLASHFAGQGLITPV